jgi:hypothetical protein
LRAMKSIVTAKMKTELLGGRFHFGLHLFQMLAFRVEFRANDLYLVDCPGGVAEFAWWAKPVGVGRSPEPKLVDALVS